MKRMLKAAALGLACSLVVFVVTGYGMYALLWRYDGLDNVQGGTPAVVLGAWAAFIWGIVFGATMGLVSWVLCTRYFYRRYALKSHSL